MKVSKVLRWTRLKLRQFTNDDKDDDRNSTGDWTCKWPTQYFITFLMSATKKIHINRVTRWVWGHALGLTQVSTLQTFNSHVNITENTNPTLFTQHTFCHNDPPPTKKQNSSFSWWQKYRKCNASWVANAFWSTSRVSKWSQPHQTNDKTDCADCGCQIIFSTKHANHTWKVAEIWVSQTLADGVKSCQCNSGNGEASQCIPEQSEERLKSNSCCCGVTVSQFCKTLSQERRPIVEKKLFLTDAQ